MPNFNLNTPEHIDDAIDWCINNKLIDTFGFLSGKKTEPDVQVSKMSKNKLWYEVTSGDEEIFIIDLQPHLIKELYNATIIHSILVVALKLYQDLNNIIFPSVNDICNKINISVYYLGIDINEAKVYAYKIKKRSETIVGHVVILKPNLYIVSNDYMPAISFLEYINS